MSHLRVYWPDEMEPSSVAVVDEPVILPFPGRHFSSNRFESSPRSVAIPIVRRATEKLDAVSRARLIYSNRQCRRCGYPVVEPLDLDDGEMNGQGREVPGTATIVGFRCHSCDSKWST